MTESELGDNARTLLTWILPIKDVESAWLHLTVSLNKCANVTKFRPFTATLLRLIYIRKVPAGQHLFGGSAHAGGIPWYKADRNSG